MKRQRGFSIELILYAIAAVAVIGFALWLMHKGAENEKAKWEKVNAEERIARKETIDALNQDMSDITKEREEARAKAASATLALRNARKGRLHEFVAKDTSCISTGFVLYTNAAAAGVPLGVHPGPEVANAPAGIGTDDAADTIARNYDKYHDCKAAVAGILEEFQVKRQAHNAVIDGINRRTSTTERKMK